MISSVDFSFLSIKHWLSYVL